MTTRYVELFSYSYIRNDHTFIICQITLLILISSHEIHLSSDMRHLPAIFPNLYIFYIYIYIYIYIYMYIYICVCVLYKYIYIYIYKIHTIIYKIHIYIYIYIYIYI